MWVTVKSYPAVTTGVVNPVDNAAVTRHPHPDIHKEEDLSPQVRSTAPATDASDGRRIAGIPIRSSSMSRDVAIPQTQPAQPGRSLSPEGTDRRSIRTGGLRMPPSDEPELANRPRGVDVSSMLRGRSAFSVEPGGVTDLTGVLSSLHVSAAPSEEDCSSSGEDEECSCAESGEFGTSARHRAGIAPASSAVAASTGT